MFTMSNRTAFPTFTGSTFFGQQNENYNDKIASQHFQTLTPVPRTSLVSSTRTSSSIVPTTSTVVIGKGSVPKKAMGNRKLRDLVQAKIPDYVNAESKMVKSSIVTDLYFAIEEACLEEGNSHPFVRYDRNGYTRSSESIAREKITSTFRDCLHNIYKSSSKNKVAKRRLSNKKKAEIKRENLRFAQEQQLHHLKNELLQLQQAEKCMSSSPELVQSSCNYQQPKSQQEPQVQQQQLYNSICSNRRNSNSFQDLYNKMFTANQLQKNSRIGTFSAPHTHIESHIEFDRTFIGVDLEPVPIDGKLDYSSTSSASSCADDSCFCSA